MGENLVCNCCSKAYSLMQNNGNSEASSTMKKHFGTSDVPLLLVCGHTFCHQCLVRLYQKKGGIQCPTCGACTECFYDKSGIKGLYPHMGAVGYLVLADIRRLGRLTALVEGMQKKKILKSNSSGLNCSECMQQTAAVSCVQCGVNICRECFDMIHQNSRVLKQHQSIPITKSAHNLSTLDCRKHHSLTDYYCIDDSFLICSDCIHQDHDGHKIISLREKSQEMVPDVKSSLHKVNSIKQTLEKSILDTEEEILNVHAEVKQKANNILSYFMEVSGKLQSNYLVLMNDLEHAAYKEMHQLVTHRDAYCRQLKNLDLLCSDARLILSSEKENDTAVVDPVETLQMLKLAEQSKCVFRKISYSDEHSSSRFDLKINSVIFNRLDELAVFQENQQFEYLSEKSDCCFVEDVSEDDQSDVLSTDSSSSETLEKDSTDKLMVVRIPPAQNQELVFVTLVSAPDDFYIQRRCDQPQLNSIEKGLKTFSYRPTREGDVLSCVCVGELCVTCSSGRKWCRARVLRVLKQCSTGNEMGDRMGQGSDHVEVLLIDYGKKVKTKVSCLRNLPQQFHRIPPLAFPCSLVGVRPNTKHGNWNESAVEIFAKMVSNRPVLMTTVKREGGRRYVDLHKPAPDEIDHDIPMSVRDTLIFMEIARFVNDVGAIKWSDNGRVTHRDYFKPSTLPSRSNITVVLSHFVSVSTFFVQQLDSSTAYLESLSEKIQKFANQKCSGGFDPTSPFSILKPCVNMPCLAKYDLCGMWFRAKITKVMEKEHKVEVYYVDYGNDSVVSLKQLLKIPDQFMKLPYQGLMCRLADVAPPDGDVDWNQESLDRFFELAGEDQLRMFVKSHYDDAYSVELFDWTEESRLADNQLSINERLVHEGFATGITAHKVVAKQVSPHPTDDANKPCEAPSPVVESPEKEASSCDASCSTVTVINCKSPALFHVQSEEQWKASNKMARELSRMMKEAVVPAQKMEWKSGDECAFYSSIEKRWCRGQLRKLESEVCGVWLVDCGFTEQAPVSSLFALPSQFTTVPYHVTTCYIANIQPAGGKKWSWAAQDLFSNMVLKKRCRLELCGDAKGGVTPVKLYLPNSADENTEVGRELILQGVALPVLKLDLQKDCSKPLMRIQQEFERSQTAYQQAYSQSSGQPDVIPPPDQPLPSTPQPIIPPPHQPVPLSDQPLPSTLQPIIPPPDQPLSSTPQPISPISPPSQYFSAESDVSAATTQEVVSSSPPRTDRAPLENDVFSGDQQIIPYPAPLPPGDTFLCCVTHIEKYNLVYVKKLPVEPVFPNGTDFIADAPLLTQYIPGTPCLANFDEDHRWYRAEITGCDEGAVFVSFVDYGLTQVIDDTNKLLVIPDQYKVLPRQAVACALPAMPSPVEVGLPDDQYLSVLATVIGDNHYLCTVSEQCDHEWGCPLVGLKVEKNKTSLTELLADALVVSDYKSL